MRKQIIFLRSAPYDYLMGENDLYDSFDLVARGTVDPGLNEGALEKLKQVSAKLPFKPCVVYSSGLLRSRQTARVIGAKVIVREELGEVKYRMKEFISRSDFYSLEARPNINKARRLFIKSLVNNKLSESYSQVMARAMALLTLIGREPYAKIGVVSHGFFLKIVESLIRDRTIETIPLRLLNYFNGQRETFKFGEGYCVRLAKNNFSFIGYIRNKGLE